MMEKFQNKYRIPSARLQNWDYGANGAYFITICTQNRNHYFGKITDGEMQLSHVGVIADILWHEIKNHAKNIELDAFQVMPNHLHADRQPDRQPQQSIGQQRFQNIGKNSISSIIGSYKSAVTKHANRLGLEFAWQPLFYDHIIRNEQSFQKISDYIINNPKKWCNDNFF